MPSIWERLFSGVSDVAGSVRIFAHSRGGGGPAEGGPEGTGRKKGSNSQFDKVTLLLDKYT